MAGKGKLSRPVNPQVVYQFFGIAPQPGKGFGVAYLCSNQHGKINKWSKIKPIRYATMMTLTAAQFAGTMNDHANGIYYGLRCMLHQGSGDGTQDDSRGWAGLHKCDWEYLPPIPGTHYGRLPDFDGYDDDAAPNPVGYVAGTQTDDNKEAIMYYDQPENLPCTVHCYTVNNAFDTNRGVNLQEIAAVADLGAWYPCILISNVNAAGEPVAPHYVRCLAENKDAILEAKKYQPLKNESNAWWGSYVAETYRDVGKDTITGGLSITQPCKKMVTLFVKKNVKSAALNDNYTQWREVTQESLPVGNIFTVPGAVGIIVNYKRAYAQGMKFLSASTYVSSGRVVVRVLPTWVKETDNMPDRTFNYTFTVQLSQSLDGAQTPVGGGQYTVSGKWAYPDEQTGMEITPILQLDIQTDLFELIAPGTHSTTFHIYWTVKSDKTGDKILNSGIDSVTHTYS